MFGANGRSSGSPRTARAPLGLAAPVFVAALVTYLLTTNLSGPTIYDVQASTLQAWGVGTTGSPWLEASGDPGSVAFAVAENPFVGEAAEHVVALRAVGTWLFATPFYAALGDSAAFALAPGAIAASVITALGVLWMFLALYRLAPVGFAVAGTLVFALGTPTWSVSADGLWGHTVTQAAIAGAALAAAKGRWWLAGAAFSLGILARAHLSIVAAVVGLGVGWHRRSWKPVIGIGLPSALGLAALAALNGLMFGRLSLGGSYADPAARLTGAATVVTEGGSYWTNLAGFTFSPGRGVLVYTPLLLLLLPSALRVWRTSPDWVRYLALGGLGYTAAQLWLNVFDGGDTYAAYRLGLELVTCLVPLYTLAAVQAGRTIQAWAVGLGIVQIGVISIGAILQPWIVEGTEWVDNDTLVFVRGYPALGLAYLGLIVACAGAASYVFLRRTRPDDAGAGLSPVPEHRL